MIYINKKEIILTLAVATLIASPVFSFVIESNPKAANEERFLVGPAKIEAEIGAGVSKILNLNLDNRTGLEQKFIITFEDFIGSNKPEQTILMLGNEKSSSSLKDFLSVDQVELNLKHGDRAIIPITVTIPSDTAPGGYFGAVIINPTTSLTKTQSNRDNTAQTKIIGRVATLIFVSVPGEVVREGKLLDFSTKNKKKFFSASPVEMRILFQNSGNVHLNPYGAITVKNIFGKEIKKIILPPWFALPDSLRSRDVVINLPSTFGKFSATLELNRGYENIVDESEVKFFILPAWFVAAVLIVIALLIYFLRNKVKSGNEN